MHAQQNRRRTIAKSALFAGAMAVLASMSALASASQQSRQNEQSQERADTAALAGVNALAAAAGLPDEERTDAAMAAARAASPDDRVVVKAISSSAPTMSVQVTIDGIKGATIKAVAHYVQPGAAIVPQQSSSLKPSTPSSRTPL